MILVRMVFHAKLGKAAEVVAGFKEGVASRMAASHARHVRILTDLSGQFDTVVQELEYDNMETFLQDMAATFESPEFRAAAERGSDLVRDGFKEYYTVEYEQ